jgi:hypothetical protein
MQPLLWPNIAPRFTLARAAGATCDAVRRQVPPQVITHAVFGIDVAINRFLADPRFCAFLDHPVADLLWRPTAFDPFNDKLAQFRMFDQFAIPRTAIRLHQMRSGTVVPIMFRHAFIAEMIALQFSEYCRSAALQNPRHLIDRDFSVPPAFYSAPFCDTQLGIYGAHIDSSR